jgi:hypothetical protein
MASWTLYDNFVLRQLNGNGVDLDTDTIKAMIVTSAYTPSKASHVFRSSVTNEVTGTGYTAGGIALGTKTVALASGVVKFDADDITILQNAAGFANGRTVVLYKDTGNPATDPLIAYGDMVSDKGNVSGDLTLIMDAAGIITAP